MSPGVELLRGLAALMVVLAHYRGVAGFDAWPLGFMFTGVDLFFVISGFVFAPYLAGKRLQWDAFLIRRFFRIYPLYLVALLIYGLLRWTADGQLQHVAPHLFFLHTLQSRDIAFYFNPAFWSLPVEVEFYLILPLLALAVRSGRGFALLGVLALLLHLLIAASLPADPHAETLPVVLSFHLPSLLVEFLLGSAAWFLSRMPLGSAMRWASLLVGSALWIGLAYTAFRLGDPGVHALPWLRGNMSVLAALSYALILVAILRWLDSVPPNVARVFWGIGNLSYGVYLLHNAAPQLMRAWQPHVAPALFAVLCLLLTLAAAWVLHHLCEAPWRQLGRKLARAREPSAQSVA